MHIRNSAMFVPRKVPVHVMGYVPLGPALLAAAMGHFWGGLSGGAALSHDPIVKDPDFGFSSLSLVWGLWMQHTFSTRQSLSVSPPPPSQKRSEIRAASAPFLYRRRGPTTNLLRFCQSAGRLHKTRFCYALVCIDKLLCWPRLGSAPSSTQSVWACRAIISHGSHLVAPLYPARTSQPSPPPLRRCISQRHEGEQAALAAPPHQSRRRTTHDIAARPFYRL